MQDMSELAELFFRESFLNRWKGITAGPHDNIPDFTPSDFTSQNHD
jgi:hypothetical protein